MKNAFAWTMLAAAAALTVPAWGGGVRTPTANTRSSVANRARNILPAMPMGSGRIIELSESYSILDTTSIFDSNRRLSGGGPPPPPPPPPSAPTVSPPVYRAAMFDDIGPVALMEVTDTQGRMTIEYLREGQTFSWDGSKAQEITLEKLRLVRTSAAGTATWIDVAIGRDLNGQQIGTLPTMPGYVSQDTTPARNPGTGTTRFRRSATGGTPGGTFGNGMLTAPGNGAALGAPTAAPSDPPLPPGSADDLARRMALRRQNQLSAQTGTGSMPTTPGVR